MNGKSKSVQISMTAMKGENAVELPVNMKLGPGALRRAESSSNMQFHWIIFICNSNMRKYIKKHTETPENVMRTMLP